MPVSQHHRNTLNKLDLQEMLELNKHLVGLIKAKRAVQAKRMKRSLFIGSKVSFEDNDGQKQTGQIIKIMRKYAKVDVGHFTWRVPLTALTKEVA